MKITTNQLGQYLPTLSRSIGDALHLHAVPSRTTMAKTFDGPPTLERSGSEHRVGRLHPRFLRKRGLGRKWSSPCRRDGKVEKSAPSRAVTSESLLATKKIREIRVSPSMIKRFLEESRQLESVRSVQSVGLKKNKLLIRVATRAERYCNGKNKTSI